MKSMQNVIKIHQNLTAKCLQKWYSIKRKFPTDPEYEYTLPTFQYPTAKSTDRRIYVCGLAETGALGIHLPKRNPKSTSRNKIKETKFPTRITFGEIFNVTDIACGYGFTAFAVKSSDSNKVFGTGLNTDSQIGYHAPRRFNPLEMLLVPAPISLPLSSPKSTKIISISAGRAHLSIVTDNEGTFTLGNNAYGQCGRKIIPNEDYKSSMILHHIKNIDNENIIKTQCGQDHSMFLTDSGKVYACGWGADGQLGRGHYKTEHSIEQIAGDIQNEKIVKLACTADCILALNDKGEVFGWGNTEYGQLSINNQDEQQVAKPRSLQHNCQSLGKIVDIAVGGSFCMVLNEEGEVFTWGYGILGKGPDLQHSLKPVHIPSTLFGRNEFNPDSKVSSISCGVCHMTAITNKGDLYTWGRNKHGCLGLGNLKDQYFPLKSSVGAQVMKVSCSIDHTVALCKPFI